MEQDSGNRALIAIFVSRFEAIEVASMLRGYGLHASVDAEAYASTVYYSMALGGHRLYVFREDYEVASEILRACGVEHASREPRPPTLALKIMAASVAAFTASFVIPMVASGAASVLSLGHIPMAVYSLPVDPKGRPDYFLAPARG